MHKILTRAPLIFVFQRPNGLRTNLGGSSEFPAHFLKIRSRPAACGHVNGRFAPESKPSCGRGGGIYTGASRPKRNRPAACGHVHGRFAPERKPACGGWAGMYTWASRPKGNRWTCTRTLCARKETNLQPVGM